MVNECETGQHDCDRNAKCIDTFESYTCACKFFVVSVLWGAVDFEWFKNNAVIISLIKRIS